MAGRQQAALCSVGKCHHHSHVFVAGIEDTFRTAATEVSLLAGSEDFNATKLFEVGKQPSQSFSKREGAALACPVLTLAAGPRF